MESKGSSAGEAAAGLIVRQREPVNFEYPFDQLSDFFTPNHLFYIRSHFKAPQLDADTYALKVDGAVAHAFSISYAELRGMDPVTWAATLECAGNGRVFLTPQVDGAQWQLGAVSTANWTGVPLAAILRRAEVAAGACEIVLEGADRGRPKEKPLPPRQIQYARSINMATADDVLIAYAMNGEALAADHGFPVRAIVRGHYGMASVKWLTRIHAVTEPFRGYWQTSDYGYWDEIDGHPVRRALSTVALKSSIARPRMRECVRAGETYRVFGAAWGGDAEIEAVEISGDGGASWAQATLLDPAQPFVWRRWEFLWKVPEKRGTYLLRSRARNSRGETQPDEHDKRFGSYVIDHTLAIEVTVC